MPSPLAQSHGHWVLLVDQVRFGLFCLIVFSLRFLFLTVIQFALTPIGFPGHIYGPLHINQFTAAAYVSIAAAVILLILLLTIFQENYIGVDTRKAEGKFKAKRRSRLFGVLHVFVLDKFHFVPKADLRAAILLMTGWFAAFFMLTNTDTVESPYTMANFNWSSDDAVFYNSLIMGVSTFLSFILYIIYTVCGKRINERISILVGLIFLFGFYVITFSWSFYTEHLDFKSSSKFTLMFSIYSNDCKNNIAF